MKQKILRQLERDPVMRGLIGKYEFPQVRRRRNHFHYLVAAIVNQQLSDKAAGTIFARIEKLLGSPLQADRVLKVRGSKIRGCGVSVAKTGYIKGLAKAVDSGALNLQRLVMLSDEEVVDELTKVKGIGQWTVEMFLIFSLGRPDIFSLADLGLRTAVSRLYKVGRDDYEKILEIAECWRPYRSFACRYLWRSLDS